MIRRSLLSLALCGLLVAAANFDCYQAPSVPQDRRTDKNTLSVVTFNCEWLMWDGNVCPGSTCPWHNQTAAQTHIDKIASVLAEINADVYNLVEVQDCNVLSMVIDAMGSAGKAYRAYLLQGTDTATEENVGLLTKIDPDVDLQRTDLTVDIPVDGSMCDSESAVAEYKASPDLRPEQHLDDLPAGATSTGLSKHYYTTITVNGQQIFLLGLHLKAIPTDPNCCFQREGQSTIVASIISSNVAATRMSSIVMGDFNDYDFNLLALTQYRPTARTFSFIKSPDLSSTYSFYNVGAFSGNRNDRFSNWWDKNGDCTPDDSELTIIDHILVGGPLQASLVASAYVDAFQFSCADAFYSDHLPVMAVFDVASSK